VTRLAALWLFLTACGSTVDSIGDDGTGPGAPDSSTLRPLLRPTSYPNAFRDVLGKTDTEIQSKLAAAFARLFHGDPTTQAVYFTVGDDQAYIQDVLHGDVRTEGVGLGMMIALELDKREEFDKLWRFARSALEYSSGPNRGYYRSSCGGGADWSACIDPFGHQTLIMALLLAHGRWTSRSGDIDYGSEMLRLLQVMRSKEAENGGVVDGVVNMFDETAALVLDAPSQSAEGITPPSSVMPGYYELWAEASADPFWTQAASTGRTLLETAAQPTTGFLPLRVRFDGSTIAGSDTFQPEGYRAQLNMVIDQIWSGSHPWYSVEADKLLSFFSQQGLLTYCMSYSLDGATCITPGQDPGLITVNGVTAIPATVPDRMAFIDAAWNVVPPDGANRYYAGIIHLFSLLILSGELQVY
jgi:oligosaccharide reducing-end xylanase